MRTVMLNEPKMTVDELMEKLKSSDRPVYLGPSDRPIAVVHPIKRDLEPEQRKAVRTMKDLLQKLRTFEEKYRMDSADFFYRFENTLLEETPDYVSWWISYSAFASTLQRYNLTRSDVECLLMEDSVTTIGNSEPS